MDRGAWQAIVHGGSKSRIQLKRTICICICRGEELRGEGKRIREYKQS